jgi:hypothetical protein
MNSMAFLLLANSNSKVDGNQISFGTVDFQLHPPSLRKPGSDVSDDRKPKLSRQIFGFDSPFRFNKIRSVGKQTATIAMSESSVGSSSEENSSVSFATTENTGEKNPRT